MLMCVLVIGYWLLVWQCMWKWGVPVAPTIAECAYVTMTCYFISAVLRVGGKLFIGAQLTCLCTGIVYSIVSVQSVAVLHFGGYLRIGWGDRSPLAQL